MLEILDDATSHLIFAVLEDFQLILQKQLFREELPLIGKLLGGKSANPKQKAT